MVELTFHLYKKQGQFRVSQTGCNQSEADWFPAVSRLDSLERKPNLERKRVT